LKLFKELFFGRAFVFESKKPATKFMEDLRLNTAYSSMKRAESANKTFVGQIMGNKFRLRRHIRIRKAFTPIFRGKIVENTDSVVLNGRILIDRFILFLILVWSSTLISVSVLFIYYSGMDEATDWFMTIPFIFILLLLLMIVLMARAEIDDLEESLPLLLEK
jgi:hypothetical protein